MRPKGAFFLLESTNSHLGFRRSHSIQFCLSGCLPYPMDSLVPFTARFFLLNILSLNFWLFLAPYGGVDRLHLVKNRISI